MFAMSLRCCDCSVEDSPATLLDAVIMTVSALASFGFGLVSVAREVDDEVATFAHTSTDTRPVTLFAKHCMTCLTEVHDFASKLCGLALSVQDTHALHRFEVRAITTAADFSEHVLVCNTCAVCTGEAGIACPVPVTTHAKLSVEHPALQRRGRQGTEGRG